MENILAINLSSSISPVIQEVRGRDYIEYGTDEWKNLSTRYIFKKKQDAEWFILRWQ